jgi:hypothetical protein
MPMDKRYPKGAMDGGSDMRRLFRIEGANS